jgi:hypothetical protein
LKRIERYSKIVIREHSSTSQKQTQRSPPPTLNESIKKLIFCAYSVPINLRNARKLNEKLADTQSIKQHNILFYLDLTLDFDTLDWIKDPMDTS